jgi:hypothetical protein
LIAANAAFAQTADTTLVSAAAVQDATAVQDASQRGSLMRVPQTAGFYFATMNHQSVVDAIFESNAYQSIKASDVAKGMKKAYRRGRTRGYEAYNEDNPFAQYLKGYGDSIDSIVFQSVWQIAKQVIDNELFIYVDNDVLPVVKSAQEIQTKMVAMAAGNDGDDLTEAQQQQLATIIAESLGNQECPTMIMGSRLENPDGFRGMLGLARSALEQGMRNIPAELEMIQDFYRVVDEDDQYLLMADLDLSKLPWDELMENMDGDDGRAIFEQLQPIVASKRATVAMGIVDNLLVVGIGQNPAKLTDFGKADRLVDMTELKPLRDAIDKNEKLLTVSYISQEYAKTSYSFDGIVDQIKPLLEVVVREIDEIPDHKKEFYIERIEADARDLVADFGELMPAQGRSFSFTSLAKDGIRGYARSDYQHPMLDGSKALTLGSHASENTIAFFNQRMYRLTDQYNMATKWGSRLYSYAKSFGMEQIEKELNGNDNTDVNPDSAKLTERTNQEKANQDSLDDFNLELTDGQPTERTSPEVPAEDNDAAEEQPRESEIMTDREKLIALKAFVTDIEDLVGRFDTVTREKLLPAIDGQEAGLFVEAISGPNAWHAEMPPSGEPLPLPMPALVVGTNDAAAVEQTFTEYWSLLESLIESAQEHFPEEEDLNELALIPPVRSQDDGAISFRWSVLRDLGEFDASIQSGSLIADNWYVINLHPRQAGQLSRANGRANLFGPADSDEPSIGTAFYNHGVAMDSLEKWINYAEAQIPADEKPYLDMAESFPAERDTLQFTEPQLRDAFERVWAMGKCWKGMSFRTYEDEDETVSEYLLKFEDIAK